MPASPSGLLLVDKERGPTSFDVVARARKAFGTRDVGHAGTLDPMATGLLVVAVGEALKLLRYMTADEKCYEATLTLGSETDTLDAEGTVTEQAAIPSGLSRAEVERACAAFLGEIDQVPPIYSAIKRDGVAQHKLARRGEQPDLPPRRVVLHACDVIAVDGDRVELALRCGAGFYVRSLARDLGRALGTRAHLSGLRRTRSADKAVAQAFAFAALVAAAKGDQTQRAAAEAALIPVGDALPASVPRCTLDAEGIAHARNGRAIARAHIMSSTQEPLSEALLAEGAEPILLLDGAGTPIALARAEADALRIVRGLFCEPRTT